MLMEMLIQYQHQHVIDSISEIEFVNQKNTFLPNKIEHTSIYVNCCIKKLRIIHSLMFLAHLSELRGQVSFSDLLLSVCLSLSSSTSL